jgi:RNA polymerase sigma factor (sigma-70 family)
MKQLTAEEIDKLALQFCDIKSKYEQNALSKNLFSKECNVCINKLSYLVYNRTNRYRKFSNYEDLVQEGFEGLMSALKNFDPSKGNFVGWANKYIGTKVSRAANNHSSLRIPIKKAGDMKPMKFSIVFADGLEFFLEKNGVTSYSKMNFDDVDEFVKKEISSFNPKNALILTELYFGNHKTKDDCQNKICSLLNINKQACVKLMVEAEASFKEKVKVSLGIL